MKPILIAFVSVLAFSQSVFAQTRENFTLGGLSAFVITPDTPAPGNPWIAYAPAVGGLPAWTGSGAEAWMFDQYFAAGIAVAGIYAGDLSGNPAQRAGYTDLYNELVSNRGYAEKFSFHTRSRGGLLGYNWAADNPDKVAAIGGIYSVTNLLSYPGVNTAASHYGITTTELTTNGHLYNPIERLAGLVANDISVFHIHGDSDGVVPIEQNTQIVKDYFDANGGDATLTVIPGGGHDMNAHWWNNQPLTDFMIAQTVAEPQQNPFVQVNQQTGEIKIINPVDGDGDMDFEDYALTSAVGGLDGSSWMSIAGNYDLAGDDSVDDTGDWSVLSSTSGELSEEAQVGGDDGLIAINTEVSLGVGAWVQNPTKDIQFAYSDTSGAAKSLFVSYVGDDIPLGDFNFDGTIDGADWPIFNSAGLTDLTGMSPAEAYQLGDLDGDFDNDIRDFILFREAYEAAYPAPGAFEAMLASFAVPEPSSLLLLAAGIVGLGMRRRKLMSRNRSGTLLTLTVVAMGSLLVATPTNSAQAVVLDPGFELNDGSWTFDAAANIQSGVQSHGSKNGWTNGPNHGGHGTLYQTLTDVITDGNIYTLTVNVGQHNNFSGSKGVFRLYGSATGFSVPLSNANGTAELGGIAPPGGTGTPPTYLLDLSVTYTALASGDPFAGQNIGIALANESGIQVVWDEVRLDIEPILDPLTLQANTTSGATAMLGHATQAVDITSYEITSAGNSLDDGGWNSLEDQDDVAGGFPAGDGSGNGWEESGGAGAHALSERYLLGDSTVAAGATVGLGAGYDESVDARDLAFSYSTSTGQIVDGIVEYFSPLLGDADDDGDVDITDFNTLATHFDPGGSARVWAEGDFDGDRDIDISDFNLLASNFAPGGQDLAAIHVPEPTSLALLMIVGFSLLQRRVPNRWVHGGQRSAH